MCHGTNKIFQVLTTALSLFSLFALSALQSAYSADNIEFKRGSYSLNSASRVAGEAAQDSSTPNSSAPSSSTLKQAALNTARQYAIIQFQELPNESVKAQLADQGIVLLDYVSNKAYWAKVDDFNQQSESYQLWIPPDEVKVALKLDTLLNDPTVELINVTAMFHKGIAQAVLNKKLRDHGIVGTINWLGNASAQMSASRDSINALIAWDELKWIEQSTPRNSVDNATSAERIRVDEITRLPRSLNGAGITIGVWDEGIIGNHADISSRVTILTDQPIINHTTAVVGTAIGNGSGDADATGMATAANVRNWSFNDDNFTNDVRNEALDGAIDIANFSFGPLVGWSLIDGVWIDEENDELFGAYTSVSATYDSIVHDSDVLIFQSGGNHRNDCNPEDSSDCDGDADGYDSITPGALAKNIVTVGATTDSDEISSFSSWGPADDGRIKPDLCANGTSLTTTAPDNQYQSITGTSFSAPSAAGAAALLYQHYENIFDERPADAAIVKGAMIHSAEQLGLVVGPEPVCGWGLINAEAAAQLIEQEAFLTGQLSLGTQLDVAILSIPANTEQVKVTLVWTDPAGDPAVANALVNDLDLRLVDTNNQEHLPWSLASNDGFRTAVRSSNNRDNVEQVVIDNPPAGDYTVRILTDNITTALQDYVVFSEFVGEDDFSMTESEAPANVSAGESFTASTRQVYAGMSAITLSVEMGYYLSIDNTFSSDDILLETDTSTLSVNDLSDSETESLTIALNIVPGDYFLLFVADHLNIFAESNETNNTQVVPITVPILPSQGDFSIMESTLSDNQLLFGRTFSASTLQTYAGTSTDSLSVVLGYYLSTDATFSADDILLETDVSTLAQDDTSDSETEVLSIPLDVAPGDYFVLFVVDHLGAFIESSEDNNIQAVAVTVIDGDDLTIVAEQTTVSSNELLSGDSFSAETRQAYAGRSSDVLSVDLGYYLSTDATFSANDILLETDTSTLNIEDFSDSETEVLTIPINIVSGEYFLLFVTDHLNEFAEVSESNNTEAIALTITGTFSDQVCFPVATPIGNIAIICF